MDMLLKFGIGADFRIFELPSNTTPHFKTGVFKTGRFKTGVFKTGFTENLGHYRRIDNESLDNLNCQSRQNRLESSESLEFSESSELSNG